MVERKTFVRFYYPGIVFDETETQVVDSRDPQSVKVPERAFGFRFFDRLFSVEDGIELSSSAIDESVMYYYGGQVMTVDDVRREVPDNHILISNMESNGYGRVVKCRTGNFKPLQDDDIVLEIEP